MPYAAMFWVFAIAGSYYLNPDSSLNPILRTLACFWAGIAIGRCLRLIFLEK